ncbi:MAG: damage-inducible protein CinA [Rhodospirillaceae bacterium]|nr:MAG: damage-inducible protein CinA [Rhodospirillaceae bacterium]
MFSRELLEKATRILRLCDKAGLRLVTAESCTGGLLSACLTAIPGASNLLDHGFVTYSNASKVALLGVPEALFESAGAVSEETARAMAEGALAGTGVDLAVAITGVAGPEGGTPEKPVGLVHVAVAAHGLETLHARHIFQGDRAAIRVQCVHAAIDLLIKQVKRRLA